MAKKKPDAPATAGGDVARKIWLAGVGAYGRAFSEAQESIAKVSGDTSKLFEDLVERGAEIEDTVETRGRAIAERVTSSSFSMDDRIRDMRERLKRASSGDDDRLGAIEARLASIEEKLDRLLEQPATASEKAPPRRKTAGKAGRKSKASTPASKKD